jgi:dienelactone hydrolase
LLLVFPLFALGNPVMSKQPTDGQRWLAHAPLASDFQVARNRTAFEAQRAEIRTTLWQLLGKLPPRPKVPAVKTLAREDKDTYWLERFEFDNGAGATVPGVLLLPKKGSGKAPAILWNHWHGGEYDRGKAAVFQTKDMPATPGPTLVERGYAVLSIDAYCFGERNGRGPGGPREKGGAGEWSAAKFNLWVGRTLWGMIVRDDLMALDYLCSRPEVDAQRVGVTGMSMGATRTWWLMALDDRPQAAVAVCCLTRYRDLIDAQMLKAHGIYYFVPGLLNHFDSEAVVACMAPRAFLSLAGAEDAGSPVSGIQKIETAAGPAWRLYGKADAFRSVIYPGVGHVYTPEMWQEMLRWFDTRLRTEVPRSQTRPSRK